MIEINGIKYERIPQPEKPKRMSRVEEMILMSTMFTSPTIVGSIQGGKAPMPRVDIENEFELIQQKKSSLSRSQREYVTKQFNRVYKEVKA